MAITTQLDPNNGTSMAGNTDPRGAYYMLPQDIFQECGHETSRNGRVQATNYVVTGSNRDLPTRLRARRSYVPGASMYEGGPTGVTFTELKIISAIEIYDSVTGLITVEPCMAEQKIAFMGREPLNLVAPYSLAEALSSIGLHYNGTTWVRAGNDFRKMAFGSTEIFTNVKTDTITP